MGSIGATSMHTLWSVRIAEWRVTARVTYGGLPGRAAMIVNGPRSSVKSVSPQARSEYSEPGSDGSLTIPP